MRKRILPLIILILLIAPSTFAQKCGTYDGYLKDQVEKFPEYYKKLSEKNKHLKLQHEKALKRLRPFKNEDGKKIIPVVVHNIYNDQGGYNTQPRFTQNQRILIPKAQCSRGYNF